MDWNKIREQFPFLVKNEVLYFDNAATTIKPKCVIDEVVNYYSNIGISSHNFDSSRAFRLNRKIEDVRNKVAKFISASRNEIIFTSGATQGLNDIALMLEPSLKSGDEIILNNLEHSSNLLPWYRLREKLGIVIKFAEVNKGKVTIDNLKKVVSEKTKVISIAHSTNTYGYTNNIKEISEFIKDYNSDISIVVDAAQSAGHQKINVSEMNIDFLVFSGHKSYGPTGIGVMYINNKKDYDSVSLGGGMNVDITQSHFTQKKTPWKYEGGTPNISGILGLGAAIETLNSIGMEIIHKREIEIQKYCINQIKKNLPGIEILNTDFDSNIIILNSKKFHSHDVSSTLGSKEVMTRSGLVCAKLSDKEIADSFVRLSFSFYNTKNEIDKLIEILKNQKDFISIF